MDGNVSTWSPWFPQVSSSAASKNHTLVLMGCPERCMLAYILTRLIAIYLHENHHRSLMSEAFQTSVKGHLDKCKIHKVQLLTISVDNALKAPSWEAWSATLLTPPSLWWCQDHQSVHLHKLDENIIDWNYWWRWQPSMYSWGYVGQLEKLFRPWRTWTELCWSRKAREKQTSSSLSMSKVP